MAILSFYGTLNPDFIQILFGEHSSLSQSYGILFYIMLFLALPFLILGDYMIIRFFREFMEKKLSARFTILYFSFLFSVYIASGIILYAYTGMEKTNVMQVIPYYEVLFIIIDIICWIMALSQVIIYRKTLKNKNKRRAAEILFIIYIVINLGYAFMLFPLRGEGMIYSLRILYYSSIELVPLFYLKSFLSQQYHLPLYFAGKQPNIEQLLSDFGVTKREAEIIELICEGKSNKSIADALFISHYTVKDHIYNIFQKTGVKSRIQLANLVQELLIKQSTPI
jgi:DNA-binding CsgD family transcriptional regulator